MIKNERPKIRIISSNKQSRASAAKLKAGIDCPPECAGYDPLPPCACEPAGPLPCVDQPAPPPHPSPDPLPGPDSDREAGSCGCDPQPPCDCDSGPQPCGGAHDPCDIYQIPCRCECVRQGPSDEVQGGTVEKKGRKTPQKGKRRPRTFFKVASQKKKKS